MKIEIGESLIYSWLRHVQHCQVVQTNWKASPIWLPKELGFLDLMRKAIEDEFYSVGLDIFHGSSTSQFLQQAEIDVVGVSHVHSDDGQIQRCYHFVDVAFHEGGLGYGSKEETTSRVLKKFIRSYFIYLTYFDDGSKGTFYFITPKMSVDTLWQPMKDHLSSALKVFQSFGEKPDFQLLANDDFCEDVLTPVMGLSDQIADTSELFLRSYQLWKLFENGPKPIKPKFAVPTKLTTAPVSWLIDDGKEKIGQHVQNRLQALIEKDKLDGDMIEKLLNAGYSKVTFNLNFPFLRRVAEGRKDKKGRPRYYAKAWQIQKLSYYFCNDWYEYQRTQFDNWFDEVSK